MEQVRLSTQVYVLVEGERKALTHTDDAGVTRNMQVDIDLNMCPACCALVGPSVGHHIWHMQQEDDDG